MSFKNWFSRYKLTQYRGDGETIPAWAGIVRHDFDKDGYLYAPLVLNWIIRWGYSVWLWAQAGYMQKTPFELGYICGHRKMREGEYQAGYRYGYQRGLDNRWELLDAAKQLRAAQREYMAHRGDDVYGQKVAAAGETLDGAIAMAVRG